MKDGINGPADYYSRIPADAIKLHQISQNVKNEWSGQVSTDKMFIFGGSSDEPVTGDWNADDKTEIGNYKGNGVWALDFNGNGAWDGATTDKLLTFGSASDQPVTGDWNGDGKTEIGSYKNNGAWELDFNGNGIWDGAITDKLFTFGSASDQPVTGDWNGDGKDDMGFYRSLNFYLYGVSDAGICAARSVSGCKVCNVEGTAWADANSRCAAGQVCSNGACVPRQTCLAKTCAILGNYRCGSWSDGCGGSLNCGICVAGKSCNSLGQCVASYGGGTIIENPAPNMVRAEILAKIAEIKQLIIKLIVQLIAELQKQLLAMPKSKIYFKRYSARRGLKPRRRVLPDYLGRPKDVSFGILIPSVPRASPGSTSE